MPHQMHQGGGRSFYRSPRGLRAFFLVLTGVVVLGIVLKMILPGVDTDSRQGRLNDNAAVERPASPNSDHATEPVAEQSGFAMGTYVRLRLSGARAADAVRACMAELERLEHVFNRFMPESEVARLNAQAGAGWVDTSPDVRAVLRVALEVAHKSEGAYDPTIAPLVDLWGFREKEGRIPDHTPPSNEQVLAVQRHIGYRGITLDDQQGRVKLAQGIEIDLGGIAKGYAVDRLAEVARTYGVTTGLIDLGGNIRAMGDKAPGVAWRIAVRHPRQVDEFFAVVPVSDKSIATSGDYQRFFTWKGRRYCHILDPRTGQPVDSQASVTVIAPTGVLSDALSTATFVLGPRRGKALLESMPGVEGIFISTKMRMSVTRGLAGVVERSTR